jgi:16S rRNA (guanine1516-N2)-methyltransferase
VCGVSHVLVVSTSDDRTVCERAAALAEELGLPLGRAGSVATGAEALLLAVTGDRLELRDVRGCATRPVFVDFVYGPSGFRRRSDLSRRQPLAAAVGVRRHPSVVVDATAGLARDSFLLASLGCTVVAVERSVVLGALIRDALVRAEAADVPALRVVLDRLTLVIDDARTVLAQWMGADGPDVVYIDPMYPPRKKHALPKKEMRVCRRLVGDDDDASELVAAARQVSRRVVVKRPRRAPPLAPSPSIRYEGKQVRYDVYIRAARAMG